MRRKMGGCVRRRMRWRWSGEKREEGGMKVEKVFREIRMEHWRGTSAHDCITGDAV